MLMDETDQNFRPFKAPAERPACDEPNRRWARGALEADAVVARPAFG
jgi:hypothetical protein